jgi:hypothetical protein
MTKTEIKKSKAKKQNDKCTISGKSLSADQSLNDAHMLVSPANGGKLEESNINTVTPLEHMKFHGNYRPRTVEFENLKSIIDDRNQMVKLSVKIGNQILAYKRKTDILNQNTVDWLETHQAQISAGVAERDNTLTKEVKKIAKVNAFVKSALGVKGIGPVTVAYCLVYLDVELARHATCFWSYAGLAKAAHERYTKGKTSGGNKTLRTALYVMATSQIKCNGAYREVYDNMKNRLEQSQNLTMSYLPGKKDPVTGFVQKGELKQMMWKDTTSGHRHGAGIRAIIKHFLADYWMVARTYYGFPTSSLYPEAILGGTHRTIMPDERGWVI